MTYTAIARFRVSGTKEEWLAALACKAAEEKPVHEPPKTDVENVRDCETVR